MLVIHVLRLNLYGNKFYVFNASLVLYSFLIVVFGTFFLRSGNLDSVHNFVIEFSRGYALVILVCLILLLCVFLFFFLQSYSFFFFFRKTKKSLLLVSFIFSTILYTLFVYSGTFFPFFCKIFFQDSVWVSASFYNLISLYYFTFILYLYFNFFWSNRLIYILGTLLSFILGAHFFMLTWSALGLFCFVLFCLGLVYLFFFRQGWSSLLHSLIVILFICIYTSQFFFNQDFLVSGFVGDQFFYQYFSLILGFPEYYTNDYFYCVVYPVYFYNTITGSIDYVFFLNKSIFLNSLSFSMKPEIFSTWIFDMYCNLLSYNQSYIYFNCSVKYFMLFFWVLVIFLLFISYISFIMFYRKVRYFIF